MAKAPTLIDITHIPTAVPPLNTNSDRIETAFLNTLSRDGSGPNAMGADLDMNGHSLLNVDSASFSYLTVDGLPISSYVEGAEEAAVAAAASAEAAGDSATDAAASAQAAAASEAVVLSVEDNLPDWKGPWATATPYELGDLVRESGSSYICTEVHTSGIFSTDLSALRWDLFAQQGAAGAGTGDMFAANNLSDVADATSARANISAQAINANLNSLSGLVLSADKGLYSTGASTVALYDLTAAGRALMDDANAAAQRTTLGLGVGATAPFVSEADVIVGTDTDGLLNTLRMRQGFNAAGNAPVYACRAWVTFAWNGTAIVIHGSGNVTSVVRNSSGRYFITMTQPMPDTGYSVSATGCWTSTEFHITAGEQSPDLRTTTTFYVTTGFPGRPGNSSGDYVDAGIVNVQVFG